ncbi:dihydrofolate reductase family protein [Pseudarthrobacter sp. N5]|uniref:dihydrofolate reductase family protein n=1 Tax=Pseudarthrobacter sp. N5 TaxID=3418416 RepID=UPI003CF1E67F
MGKLVYTGITSLDGYVADREGNFSWSAPDMEVHSFVNDLERQAGTYLYGRRMYQVMSAWDSDLSFADAPAYIRDYAEIWRSAEKIVFSRTLTTPSTDRTRIEQEFIPDAIRQLKTSSERDISISGPALAGQAITADLVDEYRLFLTPFAVGGGKPYLPGGVRLELELLDHRRFGNGVVYLHYRQLSTLDGGAADSA